MKPVSRPKPNTAAKRAVMGRNGKKKGRSRKKRKWTKRKVKGREAVVSEDGIEAIIRAYRQWLWDAYRRFDLSLEDVAAEIGATRQGFTKLLTRPKSRLFLDTFLQTCFLRREVETGFTVVVEGWKYQLRWTIERCNRGCVSSTNGRA